MVQRRGRDERSPADRKVASAGPRKRGSASDAERGSARAATRDAKAEAAGDPRRSGPADDSAVASQSHSTALIERLRSLALGLDGASEKLSHGEPTFFVRGRVFAMVDNNHHHSGHLAVWCNAPDGAQRSLVEADPEHFFIPPYVGKSGWLGVRIDRRLAWPVIGDLLRQAHATTGVNKKRG